MARLESIWIKFARVKQLAGLIITAMLFYRGEINDSALRRPRVSAEILAVDAPAVYARALRRGITRRLIREKDTAPSKARHALSR
jgi:hypothetical protein